MRARFSGPRRARQAGTVVLGLALVLIQAQCKLLTAIFSAKSELASIAEPRPARDPTQPPPSDDFEGYGRAMAMALQTEHVAVELVTDPETNAITRVEISWGSDSRHHRALWLEDERLIVHEQIEYADESRREVIEFYRASDRQHWWLEERELVAESRGQGHEKFERSHWRYLNGHWQMQSEYDEDGDGTIDWREWVIADNQGGEHRRRRFVDFGADDYVDEFIEEWLEHGDHVARRRRRHLRGAARLPWPAPEASSYLLNLGDRTQERR